MLFFSCSSCFCVKFIFYNSFYLLHNCTFLPLHCALYTNAPRVADLSIFCPCVKRLPVVPSVPCVRCDSRSCWFCGELLTSSGSCQRRTTLVADPPPSRAAICPLSVRELILTQAATRPSSTSKGFFHGSAHHSANGRADRYPDSHWRRGAMPSRCSIC